MKTKGAYSNTSIEGAARTLDYDPETGVITRRKTGRVVKRLDKDGYIEVQLSFLGKRATRPAHRVAWFLHYGVWPNGPLDHINRVKTDNRIENLREVTIEENNRNTDNPSKFAVPGVRRGYKGSFTARGKRHKKYVHLGTFKTYDEAVEAKLAFDVAKG